jgi:hypothetical protein
MRAPGLSGIWTTSAANTEVPWTCSEADYLNNGTEIEPHVVLSHAAVLDVNGVVETYAKILGSGTLV